MKKAFNKKNLLILIIFCISIGFAFLSANLVIRGLIGYKASRWDVHFENIDVIKGLDNASEPTINNSKDTVDFNVEFKEPGEIFEFTVDVVNDGTINAMISEIMKNGVDDTQKDYYDYTVKYSTGEELNENDMLKASSRMRLNIKVEYKYTTESLVPEGEHNFSFTLKFVRATEEANEVYNFNITKTSDIIELEDARENGLSNLRIYGNTEQNYTGQNLYNYLDVADGSAAVGEYTTVSDDGWITMTCDNSDGSKSTSTSGSLAFSNYFTNNLNLQIGETYSIILEVKDVSGTGSLSVTSIQTGNGQFAGKSYNFTDLKANEVYVYSKQAQESAGWGLRTYSAFASGQSGSITFRLSVIKGEDVTTNNFSYEPYVGETNLPNVSFPHKIKSVTNEVSLKILGKNLFNLNTIKTGLINDSGVVDTKNDWWKNTDYIEVIPGSNYTLSWTSDSSYYQVRFAYYDSQKRFLKCDTLSEHLDDLTNTISIPSDVKYVRISYSIVANEQNLTRNNIQFELGSKPTSYEPYKENSYVFNLGDIELNSIDNYKDYIYNKGDNWYLHKEVENLVLDGDEIIDHQAENYYGFTDVVLQHGADAYLSDRYVASSPTTSFAQFLNNVKDLDYAFDFNISLNTLRIKDIRNISLEDYKTWLSNNNIHIKYGLKKPYEIKIEDENLINQLNEVKNINLFEGNNYIYVNSNVTPNLYLEYINN